MTIEAPILTKLLADKDSRSAQSFSSALACLNSGLEAKKIWNVEVNDAKFTLSNGVNRALDVIIDRWRAERAGSHEYAEWQNDFSSYCSFNQASGRIKRLTKNAPHTVVVCHYIEALQEVASIWNLIQSLKPYIVKGRRPSENKTETQIADELSNTGICAICDRRQKLDAGKMVHHGYQMSDYNHSGYRMGKCFGTRRSCYELSNEANVAYAPILANQLKSYRQALKTLKSGTVETLTVNREKYEGMKRVKELVTLKKGTPEFERELASQISQTEDYIRYTLSDIKINDAKITGWTLQPLKYGGK